MGPELTGSVTKNEVFDCVSEGISTLFLDRSYYKGSIPEVTAESTVAELGIDSLDLVELCMWVEEKYPVTISDEDLGLLNASGLSRDLDITVGSFIELIKAKLAA